jgi:UDP-N-acetylmuramate--alanine ligase
VSLDLAAHRHVHLVGIGGIGMSALARFLLARGHEVSGSDRQWNEQLDGLQALGARVWEGHDASYLGDADLVIVTSAAAPDNLEIVAARQRGISVIKRAVLLATIANAGRAIAVAGTHGKTTTSALIGHILTEGGLDPTILIGGVAWNLGSNARMGEGDWIVVEADEYDRSFLHLRPEISVITGVEPDHLDIYGTPQAVRKAFHLFAEGTSAIVIACADDPHIDEVVDGLQARIIAYGTGAGEWRAEEVHEEGAHTSFVVMSDGHRDTYCSQLAGLHNVRNVLGASIAARCAGVEAESIGAAIESFQGVQRRFEIKGEQGQILVIDDYAHHPSEIATNLAALKSRYGRRVLAVFQPHTYSRTQAFLDDFARSFGDADTVYVMDVYAARETDSLGVSGRLLAERMKQYHSCVMYTGTESDTISQLVSDVRPLDIVITMGAGDVGLLGPRLLDRLRRR